MPKPMTAIVLAALATVLLGPSQADARSHGPKRSRVTEIIVHATGGPSCQRGQVVFSPAGTGEKIKKFFEASSAVSIHYIVDRDGRVLKSVPEDEIARHTRDNNDGSIGIELINGGDGRDAYPVEQIQALTKLVREIQARWRIPLAEVKGHDDVDSSTFACGGRQVRRKQDPGPLFPWEQFKAGLQGAAKSARTVPASQPARAR